jgi:hypothetical protein
MACIFSRSASHSKELERDETVHELVDASMKQQLISGSSQLCPLMYQSIRSDIPWETG